MTASSDHRTATTATPIYAGATVRVTIAKGRQNERGTFTVTAQQHPDVAGLLVAMAGDRELVLQRPDGAQPYRLALVDPMAEATAPRAGERIALGSARDI